MTTKSIGIDADADPGEVAGGSGPVPGSAVSRRLLLKAAAAGTLVAAGGAALPTEAFAHGGYAARNALWQLARKRGLVFGSSTATWQLFNEPLDDLTPTEYSALFRRQAEMVFTEDDLLWYKLKPESRRGAGLPLRRPRVRVRPTATGSWCSPPTWSGTRASARAGPRTTCGSWTSRTPRSCSSAPRGPWSAATAAGPPAGSWPTRSPARSATTPTSSASAPTCRGTRPSAAATWPEMFRLARRNDPHATLVLNEFGFETTNEYGDDPTARQEGASSASSTRCSGRHVPLDAVGHPGPPARRVLGQLRLRGSTAGSSSRAGRPRPEDPDHRDGRAGRRPARRRSAPRDRAVADIYADYLDVTLANPAVKSLITFGLSDRYTWLQEDYPREDGAARRPLPYDDDLRGQAGAAGAAARTALGSAPSPAVALPALVTVLKVGVIGLGEVAQVVHLPVLAALPQLFEIRSACDLSPRLLRQVGDRFAIPARYAIRRN